MVEEVADLDRNPRKAGAGRMLASRLQTLSLDDRAEKLAAFVPTQVLYDEALSATKVTLVKDEESDLVSLLILTDW